MRISIDATLCRCCSRCVTVCPSEVFSGAKGEVPQASNPDACIACGHCVDVCTGNAIRHERFPLETIHDIRQDLLPAPESVLELIRSRRSNRTLTDKPIPDEVLKDILEAARYAPTAENSRKVKITVISSPDALQAIEDATMKCFISLAGVLMHPLVRPLTKALLPDLYAEAPGLERLKRRWLAGERPCLCNARTLLVFSAPKGYDFGWQDCNLSYQNASLMAQAHGVSQIYMGLIQTACKLISSKRVTRLMQLPPRHKPYALMAIGIPAFQYPRYTERN